MRYIVMALFLIQTFTALSMDQLIIKDQPLNGALTVYNEQAKEEFKTKLASVVKFADKTRPKTAGLDYCYLNLQEKGIENCPNDVADQTKKLMLQIQSNEGFKKATFELQRLINENADVYLRKKGWAAWIRAGRYALKQQMEADMNKGQSDESKKLKLPPYFNLKSHDPDTVAKHALECNSKMPMNKERRTYYQGGFIAVEWFMALNLSIDNEAKADDPFSGTARH